MIARSFSGGYRFKGFRGQPKDELAYLGPVPRVVIPLSQGFGSSLEPLVKVGHNVCTGQTIASCDDKLSSPIHSSICGKVVNIEKRNYFKREISMVVIEGRSQKEIQRIQGYTSNWQKLEPKKIEELIYKSGVSSLDREGIPTRFKSSIIGPEDVEDLIIHGGGSEAYNISLGILLEGRNLFSFVEGIKVLKKIMPKAKIHLAINKKEKKLLDKIKKLTINLDKFKIYSVVPKYPQGYDEVLIPTLLGKKFPYGYSAANIGAVVLNIQATLGVYAAVIEGKPLIERTIALCGPSFKENFHLKVRVGTPLEYILRGRLKEGKHRVILNSLLTGIELNDLSLPVNRTFSQIIAIPEDNARKLFAFMRPGVRTDSYSRAFSSRLLRKSKVPTTNVQGDQRPCIQCGYCLEVCPVSIIPTLIDRCMKSSINETLMNYGIFNCIECGLCSYVCPSKIPLAQNLKVGKEKLIEIGCDQSLCILPKFNLKGLDDYKGVKKLR